MKHVKKLLALALSALLIVAMSVTAFASNYTITVNGAQKDGVYTAYKIFDATVSASGSVSYTIPDGSSIEKATNFDTVFTTTKNGGKTYVTQKTDVADTAVISWLKSYVDVATLTPAVTNTNSSGATSITLDVGEAGYYYITSTVGSKSAVEVTSAKPTASINDKTETSPSVDPTDGKKVDGVKVNDMQVGDIANFTVQFTATNYATDENGNVTAINSYTVTDTPDGFAIDKETVKVTVNGDGYAIANQNVTSSVDATTGVLTVTIPWDQTTYTSPSTVVVSYSATLTNNNLAAASSNKAEIKYNDTTIPGTPETKTYNYTVAVTKVDADNNAVKLAGAQFVLKNSDDEFYAFADGTGTVSWVATQDDATVAITDANGEASFQGLKSGTYTLVEVKAPDGYNLAADKEFTLAAISTELEDTSVLTQSVTVEDKTGSTLPSTGGMGTTMFYVFGGLLVVGAGVVLVTRKRMHE